MLLVTIDTLRADRVGRGLTPNIDAVAREGIAFAHARANVPLTLPSHAAIMTGSLPPENGVRENGVHRLDGSRPTIARVLRGRGYRTAAFVGAYVLDRRFGLADGFEHYDDRIPRDPRQPERLEAERTADKVVAGATAWLQAVDATSRVFLWAHLYDPHAPYTPPPEFLKRARGQAYDGEVAFADAQAGALIAAARARFGANLVIVIAGDHGESLGEHGESTHGMLAYDSTLRVPLIIAGPGIGKNSRVDAPATLRDLAPTLLGRVAAAPPREMTGRDLLAGTDASPVYAETTYPRTAGWSPLRVLADERWKLIVSSEHELYDLTRDPGEQRNVASAHAPVVAALSARADQIFASGRTTSAPITGEAAERLRALGYVAASPTEPGRAPDSSNPREHIDAWNRFEAALSLMSTRRTDVALPELRELASKFPDARVFHATYANALRETGRRRDAMQIYRKLVARWPEDPALFHELAIAAREAGDAQEALRAERAALALSDGHDANAQNGLGLLHSDAGRNSEAAAAFERATELDPNNTSFWTNLGNARRALGDLTGAERAYTRALQINPGYADAANGMGVILVQQQRAGEAVPFLERAAASDSSLIEAQLNLGIALQESGQPARAAEQYRKVMALAPAGSNEKRAASELLTALRK